MFAFCERKYFTNVLYDVCVALSLGIRSGDRVTVTCTGDNEMAATVAMQSYFWNHL